jgi:hypothetical protein
MGWLIKDDDSLFSDNMYCRLCLIREQKRENPTISKLYNTSYGTASGNWLQHATKEHEDYNLNDDEGSNDKKQQKLMPWLSKLKSELPSSSQWEFNRDLGLMICRDLLPFEIADKPGFSDFVKKNCQFPAPAASTISTTVLTDIYSSLKVSVIQKLKNVTAATIMMDGWTDKYNRAPYFAIRLSTIIDWEYHVITLAVQPVESHTAKMLTKFVKEILVRFFGDSTSVKFFNTTDGAANMIKLSQLLGHERNTCVAHSVHNLLTVDTMNKVDEIQAVLAKCKEAVRTLHFKSYMLDSERLRQVDKEIVEAQVMSTVSEVYEILQADENISQEIDESFDAIAGSSRMSTDQVEIESDDCAEGVPRHRGSRRLQNSVPTRWNSVLVMIRSVLDLYVPMNEVLKKIGQFDKCLDDEDKEILDDLFKFLTPFERFTKIFSQNAPTLSLVPLIVTNIRSMCTGHSGDSPALKQLKRLMIQVCRMSATLLLEFIYLI